jgi:hypothetical protein
MKSIWNFALLKLAVGSLAALSFNAGLANAQNLAGRFTLPFEAHWGLATLPAGDYSFVLEGTSSGNRVQVFRGAQNVAFVMNQSYDPNSSGGMSLTVIRNSDGYTVRDLNVPEIGKVLHYLPNSKQGSADREREIAQIPITGK